MKNRENMLSPAPKEQEAPAGFEPAMADLQSAEQSLQGSSVTAFTIRHRNDLAHYLALLKQESADLAVIVEAWAELPEAIKAGILAMVQASGSQS